METQNFKNTDLATAYCNSKALNDQKTSPEQVLEQCSNIVKNLAQLLSMESIQHLQSSNRQLVDQFLSFLVSRIVKHENQQEETQRDCWMLQMVQFVGDLLGCLRWMICHAVASCMNACLSRNSQQLLLDDCSFNTLVELQRIY